jgi:uncharacterized Zn-binding protein involved in type VI secretion
MPSVARVGDAIAPHGCWSGGVITSGSPDVIIEGSPAARVGDSGTPHSWICPNPPGPHGVVISAGSGTVLINGQPAARVGDATACGSVVSAGAGTVIAG